MLTPACCKHSSNDPLEEPQPTFINERGDVMMKDFDERTIWSSDRVPLIATYNRDKMQHSLWLVECVNSFYGHEAYSSSRFCGTEVSPKQFSFQRIWQAKGSQTAATKVFLATDENATPIICLLFQDQKSLLSMRLQVVEKNDDILVDIKTEMSWSIQAVASEPVSVIRPRAKVGVLPFADILVLDLENTVYLYSGKQRLCKCAISFHLDGYWREETIKSSEKRYTHNAKIIGLADVVGSRIIFNRSIKDKEKWFSSTVAYSHIHEKRSTRFENYGPVTLWKIIFSYVCL